MAQKNILTPDLGGATDVTVIEVLVKPGDQLAVDAPVVTLESDKATMEIPTTDAGVVKEVKVKVGDKISSGSVLLVVEAEGKAVASEQASSPLAATSALPPGLNDQVAKQREEDQHRTREAQEEASRSIEERTATDVHAGPAVRRLAAELGVNLAMVAGNGPKQRILKEDLLAFFKNQILAQGGAAPLPAAPSIDFNKFGPTETQALSRIKKISGKNLQRNWAAIPHVTQFGETDITALEEFRQAQKAEMEKENIKLTPLVFIMKAVVETLQAFPHFNASLDSSGENLILKKYFHIGVAVDTPDGLVVPVIRDVDKKGVKDLAKELAAISDKARKKQLTPGDMQGGCFSISSLGGIGGTAFTPIINAPEVAILGVSRSSYKPVYKNGTFVPRLLLPLSLSYDHRVVDGADGARFLVHLSNILGDIRNLLL